MHPTEHATAIVSDAKRFFLESKFEEAKRLLEVAIKLDPFHSAAKAWHHACERHTVQMPVPSIAELQRDIRVYQEIISEDLNQRLIEILTQSIMFNPPTGKMPIVNGAISSDMVGASYDELIGLENAISERFIDYIAHTGRAALLIDREPDLKTSMWANKIEFGGAIGAHYHYRSWLSSVYYPQSSSENCAGIVFGPMPDTMGGDRNAPWMLLQPEQGTLVIFPSYIGHLVPPHKDQSPRLSIACDLMALPKR